MSELKSGDAIDFIVGGQTLTLEPVPFGNVKKVLKIVLDVARDKGVSNMAALPDTIDKYLGQIFPLFFAKGRYPFMTSEWIEENMTIPTLRKMLEAAIVVNGLQDFFDKLTGKKSGVASSKVSETKEIPSEKDGSITSSDLAMAGGPTK